MKGTTFDPAWLWTAVRRGLRGALGWQRLLLVLLLLLYFRTGAAQARMGLEVPFAPFDTRPPPVGLMKPDLDWLRPDQIPVIAIHGLASTQVVWDDLDALLPKNGSFNRGFAPRSPWAPVPK